ncbi:MAG TPA: hypothetical protein VJT15_20475 [Pyrinomonadaceae bacterium]|nr:hypothetical protein [Pyrinomonadaceae bacterium]
MDINKMAGLCLIILAVVNLLHEVFIRYRDAVAPGIGYAIVTAALFTVGVALIVRRPIQHGRK